MHHRRFGLSCEGVVFPHYNSNNPCWMCPAGRLGPMFITDVCRRATWKDHVFPPGADLFSPVTLHPISKLRGFGRWLCPGDLMHTGPLGVVGWFLGAVLWELWAQGPWVGDDKARLQQLWEAILLEYIAQNSSHRLTMLTISMFFHGNNSYTCFTGKASESLSLLYVVHEVCIEVSTGSARDTHTGSPAANRCVDFSPYARTMGMFSLVPMPTCCWRAARPSLFITIG